MVLMVIRQRECVAEAWRAELRTAFKTKTTAAIAFVMHDTAFGAGSPTPRHMQTRMLACLSTLGARCCIADFPVLPRKVSSRCRQPL